MTILHMTCSHGGRIWPHPAVDKRWVCEDCRAVVDSTGNVIELRSTITFPAIRAAVTADVPAQESPKPVDKAIAAYRRERERRGPIEWYDRSEPPVGTVSVLVDVGLNASESLRRGRNEGRRMQAVWEAA